MAVQLLISTIPCKCLYHLANYVLPFPMFSSANPPIFPFKRLAPAFSYACSIFTPSFTQSLPAFSTAGKHPTHSSACNSISFRRIVQTSLDTPGVGCQLQSRRFFRSSLRFLLSLSSPAPLTPFSATLTVSLQLTENPVTLSPFAATLTSHVSHNSFVCHSYKKHRGWGHPFQS